MSNIKVGADLKLFRGLQSAALTAVAIVSAGLIVATTALLSWSVFTGVRLPGRAELTAIPSWALAVGARQGLTVLAVFLTAGRTGAAVFSALTVTGGAICSLMLDQFGLLGFD